MTITENNYKLIAFFITNILKYQIYDIILLNFPIPSDNCEM